MMLALYALEIVSLLELGIFVPFVWRNRKAAAVIVLLLLSMALGAVLAARPSLPTALLFIAGLYRIFNLKRIYYGRLQPQNLYRATLRTSLLLMLAQVVVVVIWWLSNVLQPSAYAWWLTLCILQIVAAAIIFTSTRRHLRTTRPPVVTKHFSDQELPSISVCIPARNETADLEDCLRTIIASDYPKLEVLVLDDMSHDRTPEIIRSFAHDGVRFVKGTPPPKHWLAKNWAYERLAQEANGELLVFSGVDIRFDHGTLRALVTAMLMKKKSMMSIIPRNVAPVGVWQQRGLSLQPARYAWELSLPRRLFKRPPVLSSCWIISKEQLLAGGDFAGVASSILPESHFAKAAARQDTYSFLQASGDIGVTSLKSAADQWDTAVRTRYPQLHRRPELVLLTSAVELACLIGPLVVWVVALIVHQWLLFGVSLAATLLLTWSYTKVVQLAYRKFLWRGVVAMPFAALLNIYSRHESMWRYEFGEVTWKGRNVRLPDMQVIPHLPKIN